MATATFKFNPSPVLGTGKGDIRQQVVKYFGSISFSAAADTYATGGLSPLAGFALINLGPYSDRVPLSTYIESSNGSPLYYMWNQTTGKLQIFAGGGSGTAGLTEVTNGTALSGVTPNIFTDVIFFEVTFPRH